MEPARSPTALYAHKGPIRSRPSSSAKWRHERRAGASREVAAARIRPITSNETSHRWNRRGRSRLPLRYAPERGPLDSEGHKEQKKVEVQGNYRFETTRLASTFLDLCVSSLRRGHANLLCILQGENVRVEVEHKSRHRSSTFQF